VFSSKRITIVLVVCVGVALVAGLALASIPDGNGVIHGCYSKQNGALRVIDSAKTSCPTGYRALDWNQKGRRGAKGIPGQPGPGGITDRLSADVNLVGDNQQGTGEVAWSQASDSINVARARATVMWDAFYDGCGGNPDVAVKIEYQGSTVGVFEHMTSRTAVTTLNPLVVDHVFWADAAEGRTLTVKVNSFCGKVDVSLDVWIEEVA
jgi:hypothetical protein